MTQHGWQDKAHGWVWQANFTKNDGVHANSLQFALMRCRFCGAYVLGPRDPSQPDYVTPRCEVRPRTFEQIAEAEGWTPATQMIVLREYVSNQQDEGALADFCEGKADEARRT